MLTIFLVSLALLSLAHEFWLQPGRFFANVGESVPVEIRVGEAFQGERSESRKNRIIQYIHRANSVKETLHPTLENGHYGAAQVKMTTPGTHLIAFANTPKFLSMRADSFLLYLKEDGLDTVIGARQQAGDTQKRSRELYQRCVKTLIQVGDKADGTFAEKTGMPLDIIPVQNPYATKPGRDISFQVLFNQKPLPNALVRYWNRTATNQLHEEQKRSDAQGGVHFRLRAGNNMISLVWMVPHTGASPAGLPQADWISYWGSLTFGSR